VFRNEPDETPRLHDVICPTCERDRPISRFRGRNKVAVEGRVIMCRSCEREGWAVRAQASKARSLEDSPRATSG